MKAGAIASEGGFAQRPSTGNRSGACRSIWRSAAACLAITPSIPTTISCGSKCPDGSLVRTRTVLSTEGKTGNDHARRYCRSCAPHLASRPTHAAHGAGGRGLRSPAAVMLKLELTQHSGSFKARAFNNLLSRAAEGRAIAASGGNHGAAVASPRARSAIGRDLRAQARPRRRRWPGLGITAPRSRSSAKATPRPTLLGSAPHGDRRA